MSEDDVQPMIGRDGTRSCHFDSVLVADPLARLLSLSHVNCRLSKIAWFFSGTAGVTITHIPPFSDHAGLQHVIGFQGSMSAGPHMSHLPRLANMQLMT